ncbi:Hypothetical predicted protein [Mytilus galloprovincialis]|uniref:Uncharacterized protein n=1 Tax=Mytilus galloprovincialis TaxID=29158 RepID=A0A8B6DSC3_MYTGA|nr:Hypothetical predicted protein [Mytilus galloprovincialis]
MDLSQTGKEVKRKEDRTGEKLFKDGDEAEGGPVKKQKLDDDLEGGMEDITKAEVTELHKPPTSSSPVLNSKEEKNVNKYFKK